MDTMRTFTSGLGRWPIIVHGCSNLGKKRGSRVRALLRLARLADGGLLSTLSWLD